MAVKLRLRRIGKKKQPIYKIVAADSRSPRDGRFIEAVGLYNPRTEPATLELKEDRAFYWLKCGAIPTDTVRSLLSKKGLMLKLDLTKKNYPEEKIQEELAKFKALQEAKIAKVLEKKGIQTKPKDKKLSTPEASGATSEETKGESA